MLKDKKDLYDFIVIYLKCILWLILIGIVLPKLIDYTTFYLYNKNVIYKNSTFVSINTYKDIVVMFYYSVKSFLLY